VVSFPVGFPRDEKNVSKGEAVHDADVHLSNAWRFVLAKLLHGKAD
jgi:hypothetical protein